MSVVSWYLCSHFWYIFEEVNSFLIFRNWRTECQINCKWTSESRKVSAGHLDMICFNNIVWIWKTGNKTFSQEWSEAIGIRMRIQCNLPTSELGCQFVYMSLVFGNIKLKVFNFVKTLLKHFHHLLLWPPGCQNIFGHCWHIFVPYSPIR